MIYGSWCYFCSSKIVFYRINLNLYAFVCSFCMFYKDYKTLNSCDTVSCTTIISYCLLCTLYLFLQVLRNFPCSVRNPLKVVMGRHCGNMNLYINIIKPVIVKTILILTTDIYLLIRFSCWFLISMALPRSDSWAFQSISSFIKVLFLSSRFITSLLRH